MSTECICIVVGKDTTSDCGNDPFVIQGRPTDLEKRRNKFHFPIW